MSETLSAIISTPKRGRTRSALHVGVAGDAPRTAPTRISLAGADHVLIGRGDRRAVLREQSDCADVTRLTLADARMSSKHARITRVGSSWVLEDLGSKNGTWVGMRRIARHPLADGDTILVGHTALVFRESGGEEEDLDGLPSVSPVGLATMSPALAERFHELARAATAQVPIEITGESGTGKELVARAVHALSRRTGDFIAINCGAIAPNLVEAELFGHHRGAYTGAAEPRAGLVRSADKGTLFLDEIAELPLAAQAALLRVLQEREVLAVGSDRPVAVDLRVVTATHQDLDEAVADRRFRADLRARLLGVTLQLPPLRERREDLGLLVATLLDRLAPGRQITFSADAVAALYAHAWPLNVRELERALAAALAIADERIDRMHLPRAVQGSDARAPAAADIALSSEEQALRDQLSAAIVRHAGNLAAVARELGKDRTQIRRWMKRYGLSRTER